MEEAIAEELQLFGVAVTLAVVTDNLFAVSYC